MQKQKGLIQHQFNEITPTTEVEENKQSLSRLLKQRILIQSYSLLKNHFNHFKGNSLIYFTRENYRRLILKKLIMHLHRNELVTLKYHTLLRFQLMSNHKFKCKVDPRTEKLKALIYHREIIKTLYHYFKKYSLKAKIMRIQSFKNSNYNELRSSHFQKHNKTNPQSTLKNITQNCLIRRTVNPGSISSKKPLESIYEEEIVFNALLKQPKVKSLLGIIYKYQLNPMKEKMRMKMYKFLGKKIRKYSFSSLKDYFYLFSQAESSIGNIIKKNKQNFIISMKLYVTQKLSTVDKIKYMSNIIQNNKRHSLIKKPNANRNANVKDCKKKRVHKQLFINLHWKYSFPLKYFIKVFYNHTFHL